MDYDGYERYAPFFRAIGVPNGLRQSRILLVKYKFIFNFASFARRVGLMVSVLDSGSSGPGSSPGRGGDIVLCSLARHLTLTVPLSTQMYKWITAKFMLGVTLRWTSIPSSGELEILSVTSCYRNRDKLRPDGPLDSYADFTPVRFKNISSKACRDISLLTLHAI